MVAPRKTVEWESVQSAASVWASENLRARCSGRGTRTPSAAAVSSLMIVSKGSTTPSDVW